MQAGKAVLRWRPAALEDRAAIMDHVALDKPVAAVHLDLEIERQAEKALRQPALYRPGRVEGTREIVVHPNYVIVFRVLPSAVEILRVLHAAQRWP